MFFPLLYNKIKSYILLKININKKYFLIISFGSKNKEKFSIKQGSELITFFVKVCENKIKIADRYNEATIEYYSGNEKNIEKKLVDIIINNKMRVMIKNY